MKNFQFFSDFDGTITKEDTLNKFLRVYAKTDWLEVEEKWMNGDIGSKQCIEEQMQLFPLMEQKSIDEFIESIEIDETFPDFLEYLKSEDIDFTIVSDGFDYFNKLKFENGRFQTFFPHFNENCKRKSGVCKCSVVKNHRIVTKPVLYAGDGLSDFCVSGKVDILFAKGSLLEYCKDTKNDYRDGFDLVGFKSFDEIKNYIKSV